MVLKKKLNIKQKIITIPIIIIMLIGFILPNYSRANVLSDLAVSAFSVLIDIILEIPDSILVKLEQEFVDSEKTYDDIIYKGNENDPIKEKAEELAQKDIAEIDANPTEEDKKLGIFNYDGRGSIGSQKGNGTDPHAEYIGCPRYKGWSKYIEMAEEELGMKMSSENNEGVIYSKFTYSPRTIFSNKIRALNANFFKTPETKEEKQDSIAYQLKGIISKWYVSLRNIALVLMLLVLVFLGIKIVISSVASEQAKYKETLMDWVIAITLLMLMHYIMVFSVNIVEKFVDMFAVNQSTSEDFINKVRLHAGNGSSDAGEYKDMELGEKFIWAVMFFTLVIFTLIFTFQYIKRIIKLAFLTISAPVMALTYPIDKITDGKAQAFNRWIKDYLFTLLLQPLHLLIYTVLISAVSTLASQHPIYAIVALGYLMTVEKTAREYFGFEKGHIKGPNPAGLFAAATVGKSAMNMILPSNVSGKSGKDGNQKGVGGSSSGGSDGKKPIRGKDAYSLIGGGSGSGGSSGRGSGSGGSGSGGSGSGGSSGGSLGSGSSSSGSLGSGSSRGTANLGRGRKILRGVKRGIAGGARRLTRSARNDGIRNFAGKAISKTARLGVGALGAGALGMAGLAYGLASGDPAKAAELAVGGLATGYGLGGKIADTATGIVGKGVDTGIGIGSAALNDIAPEKYDKMQEEKEIRRRIREIKDDDAAMRKFRKENQHLSDREIDDNIRECVQDGIDDTKDIQKYMDLQQKGISKNMARGALKLSKDIDKKELRNPVSRENFRKSIENSIPGANKAKESEDATRVIEDIVGTRPL